MIILNLIWAFIVTAIGAVIVLFIIAVAIVFSPVLLFLIALSVIYRELFPD